MPDSAQIRVRRARREDLGRVGQLEARVWKRMAAPPEVIRRRFLLFPQGFQVAVTRHDMVGFCFAALLDHDARSVELDEFFPQRHIPGGAFCFLFGLTVNPIYRRRGVAGRLIQREIGVARKRSCAKVQAIANALSKAAFETAGFTALAALDHLFGEDRELMPNPVLMELRLGAEADSSHPPRGPSNPEDGPTRRL